MKNLDIVAIEPEWLSVYASKLCNFSKPLEHPSPRYDAKSDKIKCTVHCTFGVHAWILPDAEIEYEDNIDKYRWFACSLLQGDVISCLKDYTKLLLSSPKIMTKSWFKLQKRTQSILASLVSSKICSKQLLIEEWKKDSKCKTLKLI